MLILPQREKPRPTRDTMAPPITEHTKNVAHRYNVSGTSVHQLYLEEDTARRAMDQCAFSPDAHGYNSECIGMSSKAACACAMGTGSGDCQKALEAQSQCYRDDNDAIHVSGSGAPNDSSSMVYSWA